MKPRLKIIHTFNDGHWVGEVVFPLVWIEKLERSFPFPGTSIKFYSGDTYVFFRMTLLFARAMELGLWSFRYRK